MIDDVLLCGQSSNLHGKSILDDFINSISQMDDIQDVKRLNSRQKMTF